MSDAYQRPDESEDQDAYIVDHTDYDPDELRDSMAYLESNNLQHTPRYKKLSYFFSEEFVDNCRKLEEYNRMVEKDN